jgi:hypothetical protein
VLYRVKDFRDTTTIAKKKSQLEFDSELETLRGLVGIIGSRTRRLFGWQVSFFSVGTILLVGILVYEYSEKLV